MSTTDPTEPLDYGLDQREEGVRLANELDAALFITDEFTRPPTPSSLSRSTTGPRSSRHHTFSVRSQRTASCPWNPSILRAATTSKPTAGMHSMWPDCARRRSTSDAPHEVTQKDRRQHTTVPPPRPPGGEGDRPGLARPSGVTRSWAAPTVVAAGSRHVLPPRGRSCHWRCRGGAAVSAASASPSRWRMIDSPPVVGRARTTDREAVRDV
jgi:hypothetical protein